MAQMKNVNLTKIFFGSGTLILLVIIFNHLFSIISFTSNFNIHALLFPIGFITAIGFYFLLHKKYLDRSHFVISIGICCLVFISSLLIASAFYDFSWDGLWYHHASIHFLQEGWNPFYQPDSAFNGCLKTSVLHFAKGPWYISANIFSTFGNFEASKGINIVVMFAVYFLVYSTAREYKISSRNSHLISTLIVLNPVMINQLFSFLVDQLLISYLIIYVAAFIKWLKDKSIISIIVVACAAICLINTKFTGLIYFVIASIVILLYLVTKDRNRIKQALIWQAFAFIFGVFVFGYNPYVTNTVNWGHPFYPIMTSSVEGNPNQKPKDDMNEKHETPKNMVGKSTAYRFFYATFSKPGNAPFNNEKDAKLMFPFMSKPSDWSVYRFHEARVSGFGPYFSGILILSLILSVIIFLKNKRCFTVLLLISTGIIFSCIINKHFWIPRFAPQLWYLPIVPLILAWMKPLSNIIKHFSYLIGLFIFVNSAIVAYVHIGWEVNSTNKLEQQLSELKESNRGMMVHCQWFKKAMEERLDKHDIKFEFVGKKKIKNTQNTELQTIVDGYPGKVLFSFRE